MMKDATVFLAHILESAEQIEAYTKDLTKEDFLRSPIVQDAVLRRFEIVGEATKHLPKNFREKFPDVPWSEIAGMRDIITHEYFGVDLELVWNTIKKDLPRLKKQLSAHSR